MGKTFTLSRELIASEDFRCLSTHTQAMYLQCCAYADDSGVINNFWLIRDSYSFHCDEDILTELKERGFIAEYDDGKGIAIKYRVVHWDKHKGK